MTSSAYITRRRSKLIIGRTLGKWTVEKRIGRGGMGDVFIARHTELGRPAAIKVLAPQFAKNGSYVARFRAEAIATARLQHPNIVDIFDVDTAGDLNYLIMEYVEGTSLQQLLVKRKRLNPHLAACIALDTAKALHASHTAGIIHRDIKPGNILIDSRDPKPGEDFRVVLTDFGLCQELDADPRSLKPGFVVGTPYYISPEQARGLRADDRSDLYSLGVTLFVMLTGKRPFDGRSPLTVLKKQVNDPPPPILKLQPDIPMMMVRIVNKLLQKEPARRYQIAKELITDLRKYLKNNPLVRLARRLRPRPRPRLRRR